MTEVNLIGGFYQSKSRAWSAQDVVNWLPVPAKVAGARSPIKLRGLPGLRLLETTSPPATPPPRWLLKVGPDNANPRFSQGIFSSPDGDDWSSEVPVASGGPLEYPNLGYDGTILITSNGSTSRMYSGDAGLTLSGILTGGPNLSAGGGRATKRGATWFRAGGQSFRIAASTDNGTTFAEASADNESRVRDIVSLPSGRLVGVTEGTSTFVSDDAGANWSARPSLSAGGFPTGFITIERIRKTGTLVATYIAGVPADPPNQSRISISRDNGETWQERDYRFGIPQIENGEVVGLTEWGNGYIAAATQSGKIAISRNDGDTFTTSPFTFPALLRSLSGDNQKLIACGDGGQLWKTTDGNKWTKIDVPYPDADILWVTQVP